jgi:hypothetical protein
MYQFLTFVRRSTGEQGEVEQRTTQRIPQRTASVYRLAYPLRRLPPRCQQHHPDRLRGSVPTRIELPSCLLDSCRAVFPTLDFSRIVFHLGIPRGVAGASGFTMSSGGPGADIRIYLKKYDPRTTETFLLIAHELVHALQIQGMIGAGRIPGSWVTFYMFHAIGRGGGIANELEKQAYTFTNGGSGARGTLRDHISTHLRGAAPCAGTDPTALASAAPASSALTSAEPSTTTVRGSSYADVLSTTDAPVMLESIVGVPIRSLLTWPAAIVAGAYSVFGFSTSGGALGSLAGVVGGAIGGGLVAGTRRGPLGALVGALVGAYAGGVVGGGVGCLAEAVGKGWSTGKHTRRTDADSRQRTS